MIRKRLVADLARRIKQAGGGFNTMIVDELLAGHPHLADAWDRLATSEPKRKRLLGDVRRATTETL